MLEKQVFDGITNSMSFVTANGGEEYLSWFFCFGTLEEYIADSTFSLNYDIDIGVMYDELRPEDLISQFESRGYRVDGMILHDIDKKPLNIHFRPVSSDIKSTPQIDVFAWYKKGNMAYHTWDVNREKREILKEYVMRGIPYECLRYDEETIRMYRDPRHGPEWPMILDSKGVWRFDLWEDHGPYKFLCPSRYGTCLDYWYPCWKHREHFRGTSMSKKIETIKSFGEWE